MLRKFTDRILAGLVVATATILLSPTSARAQQSAATTTPETITAPANEQTAGGGQLEKITVTGYLIPRIGDGPQPVTTLDQDFINKQADQTVTDVIARLPENVGAFNTVTTAGNSLSPGSAAVGLKGLPFNATLVLVDGIRFPAYPFAINSTTGGPVSFVDLNSFPLASIDRIEILKDGGSATYGNDAVAGVVNLILKSDYKGTDLNYYYGISQRGDYEVNHGSFVSGISHNFSDTSKVSIVAAFDIYTQSPIEASDRAYSAFLQHSRYSPKYPDQANFWTPTGVFNDAAGNLYAVKPGTAGSNITANDFLINDGFTQNFDTKFQQLAPRETRYGGSVNLNYDITACLKFYDSFIIQRNEELGVTPNQGYSNGITVPANNPFNPFGVTLTQAGFPVNALYELGPWRTDTTIRTLRNTAGLTYQLPHDWFIDANWTYGESDGTERVDNSVNVSRLQEALNGTLPGFTGQFFNPFTDQSIDSPNRQFHDAIRTQQILDSRTDLVNYIVKIGGTVWDLPGGAFTVAGGYEYRSESLIQVNDENSKNFNIGNADFAGPQISGRRYVNSIYGEATLPILGGKWSWPGARILEVVLSERYDNFSDFGTAAKPKVAVRYKPIDDLTLRGTYAEGFIAPSLSQLFGTPIVGIQSINDPVTGTSYQTQSTSGGNPHLKPENSYGYFAGAVWSPGSADPDHSWWGWANGFTAYIDWYQITIRNLIGTPTAQQVVDSANGFPGAVTRGANGLISNIDTQFLNLGTRTVDGIDFGASYVTKEYPWGKLDFEANAAYIYNFKIDQFLGGGPNGKPKFNIWDQEDSYGVPDFKLIASLFYSKLLFGIDTFRTGLTINYTDSEHDIHDNFKGTDPQATLDAPKYVHLIGSFTTLDWQISYEFGAPTPPVSETPPPGYSKDGKRILGEKAISPKPEGSTGGIRKWLANTTLTFGINNIGDVKPPYSADWYQGFDTGDAVPFGRVYYVQIDKKF
jgi:outer membrane receptor protein involved in Fe transport